MDGEEIYSSLCRIKELEDKQRNGVVSDDEVREYHDLSRDLALTSLDDLKEYHNYIVKSGLSGDRRKALADKIRLLRERVRQEAATVENAVEQALDAAKDRLFRTVDSLGTESSRRILQDIIVDAYRK